MTRLVPTPILDALMTGLGLLALAPLLRGARAMALALRHPDHPIGLVRAVRLVIVSLTLGVLVAGLGTGERWLHPERAARRSGVGLF